MKIKDFYDLIDEFAPFELSDKLCKEDGCYDNSGIMIDCEDDIAAVTFSLDFSQAVVDEEVSNGSNLIVTHHPAIYHGIEKIDGALLYAIKRGVGVISAHLNLDCAKEGVDHCFAKALGAEKCTIITDFGGGTGYGRSFVVDASLNDFASSAETNLGSRCIVYGDKDKRIYSVASFFGAGLTEKEIDRVEADLYCSADITHHVIKYALEKKRAVLAFTHYGSEKGGIINLYRHFSELKPIIENEIKLYFFDDERFS